MFSYGFSSVELRLGNEGLPMASLVWKHGKSKSEAVTDIRAALAELGYDKHVTWSEANAEARYGPFASLIHVKGRVTEDLVILDKCGGAFGAMAMDRCRKVLERVFPRGEQPNPNAGNN